MNTINFKLAGLTCAACVKLVERRLEKVPGVSEISINLASGDAQVSGAANLDLKILATSLEGTPYSIVK